MRKIAARYRVIFRRLWPVHAQPAHKSGKITGPPRSGTGLAGSAPAKVWGSCTTQQQERKEAAVSGSTTSRARLMELLTPAVEATGHDLEDISVSPAGKRRVVRVIIEKDGGVSLDDIATVSRGISDLLDTAEAEDPDLLGGAYVLEVSSPGVDRPLTAPRHWRRNVGRLVKATLSDGALVTGRITKADELDLVLDVDGTERTLLLAEVIRGAVQVEFNKLPPLAEDENSHDEDDS
jgi:ribosome maturation factor RimP